MKPLQITARSFANETTDVRLRQNGYGFDFYRKWLFASFNTFVMGGNWRLRSAEGRMAWGNSELFARGKRAMACSDVRPGNLEVRASLEKMRGFVTGSAAYRDGLPIEVDEHKVNAPAEEMDAFAEATWEMVADGKGLPMHVNYCDLPSQRLTNEQAQASSLSAVLNTGDGFGMLVPEMYLGTQLTEAAADAEEGRVLAYVESIRALIPEGPSHITHLLGGWLTLGGWSNDFSPEADLKVRYDRYLHRLATDPAFADVGGAGMSTLACDEEIARWVARIIRHYCIEGRTDLLSSALGYRYRPEIVADGDFMEGLSRWEAAPAADGAIVAGHRAGYGGKKGQYRMMRSNQAIGEHFALFTRSANGPNRLSQRLSGLVPGRLYKLRYATADYDDVLKPGGARPSSGNVVATVSSAETDPAQSWIVEAPTAERAARAARQGAEPHCVTVTHRVVFRALSPTAELTFDDGPAAVGTRTLLNYVSVTPYFEAQSAAGDETARVGP